MVSPFLQNPVDISTYFAEKELKITLKMLHIEATPLLYCKWYVLHCGGTYAMRVVMRLVMRSPHQRNKWILLYTC